MDLFKLFHRKSKHKDDLSENEREKNAKEENSKKSTLKHKPSASSLSSDGTPAKSKKKKKSTKDMKKKLSKNKKQRTQRKRDDRTPKDVFPKRSVSSLSRALKDDEWQKLASALGFMEQAISHFTGRASSSQNTYSQASLMLRTWRDQMPVNEILPRLSDALKRIRRHDLALKIGLELGVIAASDFEENEYGVSPSMQSILRTISSEDRSGPPYYESTLIISDERISFLARQLLAREEWKRLAYAIGFLPHEVSQIIASASSSQNLYAQAHMMLMRWRLRTPPNEIVPRLKAGFIRIRRHDLVDLLRIGAIAGSDDILELLNEQLRESKEKPDSFGAMIAKSFSALTK
ncbi:uncharacterized protein LOC120342653 [Styela clava]